MFRLQEQRDFSLIVGSPTIRFTANSWPSVVSHQRDDGVQNPSHLDSVELRHQDSRCDALEASADNDRMFRNHFVLLQRQRDMSGPIVRTGTTPEYWKNWDQIFGDKTTGKKAVGKKAAKGAAKKAAAKKTAKKAAKSAPKKAAKKKK